MNKQVYLGLSILDRRKTLMYEFWHDYIKPKYGEDAKIMDMLYGYRQLHCPCKNRRYLQRHCGRFWKKI